MLGLTEGSVPVPTRSCCLCSPVCSSHRSLHVPSLRACACARLRFWGDNGRPPVPAAGALWAGTPAVHVSRGCDFLGSSGQGENTVDRTVGPMHPTPIGPWWFRKPAPARARAGGASRAFVMLNPTHMPDAAHVAPRAGCHKNSLRRWRNPRKPGTPPQQRRVSTQTVAPWLQPLVTATPGRLRRRARSLHAGSLGLGTVRRWFRCKGTEWLLPELGLQGHSARHVPRHRLLCLPQGQRSRAPGGRSSD